MRLQGDGMAAITVLRQGSLSVLEYRCTAGPGDEPFAEVHERFSVSYVRKGSFGCRARGESFELVAGSVLIGRPGDEYTYRHDHVRFDECLSFQLEPALVEAIAGRTDVWRPGWLPPFPE